MIVGDDNYVNNNTITNGDAAAILISGNNNLVTGNRIQEAPLAIWIYNGTGNVYPTTGAGRNTLFNVEEAISGGSALRVQSQTMSAAPQAPATGPTPARF